MNTEKAIRQEVKKYIDSVSSKVVKMVHAMLEVDAINDNDWWNTRPDAVKEDVEVALKESENGQTMSPHDNSYCNAVMNFFAQKEMVTCSQGI